MLADALSAARALGEAVNIAKRHPDGKVGRAYAELLAALESLAPAQAAAAPVVQAKPAPARKAKAPAPVDPELAALDATRPTEGDARPSDSALRFASIRPGLSFRMADGVQVTTTLEDMFPETASERSYREAMEEIRRVAP